MTSSDIQFFPAFTTLLLACTVPTCQREKRCGRIRLEKAARYSRHASHMLPRLLLLLLQRASSAFISALHSCSPSLPHTFSRPLPLAPSNLYLGATLVAPTRCRRGPALRLRCARAAYRIPRTLSAKRAGVRTMKCQGKILKRASSVHGVVPQSPKVIRQKSVFVQVLCACLACFVCF